MRTSRMTSAALATLGIALTAFASPALAKADSPKTDTKGPADITATTATFRATVVLSALGGVTWDYGTTTAYGMTTPSVATSLVAVGQDVSLPVTGLLPDTEYHVRATGTSLLTVLQGKDVKFKTKKADASTPAAPAPPATTTTPATTPSTTTRPSATSSAPATTTGARKDDDTSSSSSKGSGVDDTKLDDDGTDGGATSTPGAATADVTPVLGRTLAVATVAGTVTATAPTGATVSLADAQAIPTGTLIDARRGTVELTTALDAAGGTQTARFWGAQFEVRQAATNRGLTQLVLRGANFGACPVARAAKARASKATKKKRPARSLWGSDDHGRFQTRGRGSVATVRGTRWVTTDTCAGTRTTVLKGAVAVKDINKGRTVLVTKGHSYLARTTLAR